MLIYFLYYPPTTHPHPKISLKSLSKKKAMVVLLLGVLHTPTYETLLNATDGGNRCANKAVYAVAIARISHTDKALTVFAP
jgi:hypothetical protein